MTNTSSTNPSPRAVAAFLLGCLCFGYAFVQRVAPSVMTDELMRSFQVQAGALGALSAFYFYAYAAIQMPVGVLMDRYGPRRILGSAMALCLLGSAAFAIADTLWMAAIGRLLIGGAVAFAYVGTMTIAATWFPVARFSLSVGILQMIGMIGAMTGQAPLGLFVTAIGWRDTILSLGVIGAVLSVLIFLVVQEVPAEKKDAAKAQSGAFRDVLRRKDSWCCALIGFALTSSMLAFAGLWAVPWLRQVHGFTPSEAAVTASLVFLSWAVASPVVGWVAEKIGRRKPLMYFGILANIVVFSVFVLFPDLPRVFLYPLFMLSGIGGCTMIISFSCVREVNRPGRAGAALGFVNMFVVGSGALFQPLLGYVLDMTWDGTLLDGTPFYGTDSYGAALSTFLVTYTLAFIACILLRETHCRQLPEDG